MKLATVRRLRTRPRAAFSAIELIVVMLIIGTLAAGGSAQIASSALLLRRDSEAERLLLCLMYMRDAARDQAPPVMAAPAPSIPPRSSGRGVFFWVNTVSQTCFQYTPYIPQRPNVPDHPANSLLNGHALLGDYNRPVTIGLRTQDILEFGPTQNAGSLLSDGIEVYFQSDQLNVPNLRPTSFPRFPLTALAWNRDRIIFWPNGNCQAPFPISSGYGVTIPVVNPGPNQINYNRVYVALVSNPNQQPSRIRIDPATGEVRMMRPTELRRNGSW